MSHDDAIVALSFEKESGVQSVHMADS